MSSGSRRTPGALEALYREHVSRVQVCVARRVADPQLAADLTADIFVAAIETARRIALAGGARSRGSTA